MVHSQTSSITRLYERLFNSCRSPNQFNRLHIAIENRATPTEIRQLSEYISNHYAESPGAKWIGSLSALNNLSGKQKPEDYVRRKIAPNLYLYSNHIPAASKTLIVGFPGGAGRLMMPNNILLQHLTSADADLLFIKHRGPNGYDAGVPGLGNDFHELLASLTKAIGTLGYKRHVTLGTSAGGLPALLAAILLEFDQGTSVGCDLLDPKVWRPVLEHPKCQTAIAHKTARPRLLGVYSELFERDKLAAQNVSKKLPLVLLPVRAKIHNTLWCLLNTGDLPKFLSLVTMTEAGSGPERKAKH